MVAIKNIAFAASCVASALAAPATKRQDWGQGGDVGGWNQGGQDQGQGGQDWSQGQDSGASSGSDDNVASVPIAGDGQSSDNSGSDSSASAGNNSSSAVTDSSESSGSSSAVAAVDGETLTSSSSGNSGDYYYSHWVENDSGASMTLGDGSYSLEWTEASGNIVSGIGWNPASAR